MSLTLTSEADCIAQAQIIANNLAQIFDWMAANTSYNLLTAHTHMTKAAKSAETVCGLTPGTLQPGGVNKPAV